MYFICNYVVECVRSNAFEVNNPMNTQTHTQMYIDDIINTKI